MTLGAVSEDANGPWSLTQSGANTLTLTGNSTYNGTTTISAGTLRVGSGGTAGTLGSGNVTDNAALVFNRSDTITVSNAIGGNGTLTQAGGGTLVLTGASNYSGNTTISTGTLDVKSPGSITSVVTVSSGATLGGTGTVGAVTDHGGTVHPGFGPGMLNAPSGNLTTGGILSIVVTGPGYAAGTDYSQLNLGTGTLTLDGTSILNVDLTGLTAPGTAHIVLAGVSQIFTVINVTNNTNNYRVTQALVSGGLDLQIVVPVTVTVSSSSSNSSVFGQNVTFTAHVQNSGADVTSGTVTFYDNGASNRHEAHWAAAAWRRIRQAL